MSCVGPGYYRIFRGDPPAETLAWEIVDGREPECRRRLRPRNLRVSR